MPSRNAEAPAQRGNAGGGSEIHEAAGLGARVVPGADDYQALIRRLVDQAPPFSSTQRAQLALLLRPSAVTEAA